jgi:hypothetical protein
VLWVGVNHEGGSGSGVLPKIVVLVVVVTENYEGDPDSRSAVK